MREVNIIVVYNEAADRLLMCKRRKNPYKGLSNFVGGKNRAGRKRTASRLP